MMQRGGAQAATGEGRTIWVGGLPGGLAADTPAANAALSALFAPFGTVVGCACMCGGPVLCGGGSGEIAENNKGKFASYFDSN